MSAPWNRLHQWVERAAQRLETDDSAYRRAMAEDVRQLAVALRAIERVDSEYDDAGADEESCRAYMNGRHAAEAAILRGLLLEAEEMRERLNSQTDLIAALVFGTNGRKFTEVPR